MKTLENLILLFKNDKSALEGKCPNCNNKEHFIYQKTIKDEETNYNYSIYKCPNCKELYSGDIISEYTLENEHKK